MMVRSASLLTENTGQLAGHANLQDTSAGGLISRMRATEAASKVRELSPAEAFKEDGNAAFKRGDWQAAVAAYSK